MRRGAGLLQWHMIMPSGPTGLMLWVTVVAWLDMTQRKGAGSPDPVIPP